MGLWVEEIEIIEKTDLILLVLLIPAVFPHDGNGVCGCSEGEMERAVEWMKGRTLVKEKMQRKGEDRVNMT